MKLRPRVEVYKNAKTKIYSDGTRNTIASRQPFFKDSFDVSLETLIEQDEKFRIASEHSQNIIDFLHENDIAYNDYYEEQLQKKREKRDKPKSESMGEVRGDSLKRAKDSIFDYTLNNDFQYFFTGTINPDSLDSKSPKELLKPVQKWLNNMVQNYGLFYLMIAERHKKGGIHFHGLLGSSVPLRLVDSGTKLYKGFKKPISNDKAFNLGLTEGRTVYNLKSWKFGFTTAVELQGDRLQTAFYITKYITKDVKKIFGKFFWHSRGLRRPLVEVHDVDYDSILCAEHNGFKYSFERGNVNE